MKSESIILRRVRELRAIVEADGTDDCEARIAQAMESALLWALRDDQRYNVSHDAPLLAKFLREDLARASARQGTEHG